MPLWSLLWKCTSIIPIQSGMGGTIVFEISVDKFAYWTKDFEITEDERDDLFDLLTNLVVSYQNAKNEMLLDDEKLKLIRNKDDAHSEDND